MGKKCKTKTKTKDGVHCNDLGQASGPLSDEVSHGKGKRLGSLSFKGVFTSDGLIP